MGKMDHIVVTPEDCVRDKMNEDGEEEEDGEASGDDTESEEESEDEQGAD